jgi:hypothetical protein
LDDKNLRMRILINRKYKKDKRKKKRKEKKKEKGIYMASLVSLLLFPESSMIPNLTLVP